MPDERFSIEHLSQSNINKLFGVSSQAQEKHAATGTSQETSGIASESPKVAFKGFPKEPEDARLTVAGAIVDSSRKLERLAYVDLKDHFGNEAPKELHPVPAMPGINADEEAQCVGLKMWSDTKGGGWKALSPEHPQQTMWFNAKAWGSWRLAFLLARLQRSVWSEALPAHSIAGTAPVDDEIPKESKRIFKNGQGQDAISESEAIAQKKRRSRPRQKERPTEKEPIEMENVEAEAISRKEADKSSVAGQEAVRLDDSVQKKRRGSPLIEMIEEEPITVQREDSDSSSDVGQEPDRLDGGIEKKRRGRPRQTERPSQRESIEIEDDESVSDHRENSDSSSSESLRDVVQKRRRVSQKELIEIDMEDEDEEVVAVQHEESDSSSAAVEEVESIHEDAEFDFPPDPEDARFSVECAICKDHGRVQTSAYKDEALISIFRDEPSQELHPDPTRPGLRKSEIDDPGIYELQKGLAPWHDSKGRGWIASRVLENGKKESAWVSAVTLGSWRLALLVARLQIKVWNSVGLDSTDCIPRSSRVPAPRKVKVALEANSEQSETSHNQDALKGEESASIPVLDDEQDERQHFARNLGYRRKRKKSELDVVADLRIEAEEDTNSRSAVVEHPGGKRVRPDAMMDWRSRLLQERRLRRKGRVKGSSFDSIGDVIDEAQANRQIEEDLRILTKASLGDVRAASGSLDISSPKHETGQLALIAPPSTSPSIGSTVVGETVSSSSILSSSRSNEMPSNAQLGRVASKVVLTVLPTSQPESTEYDGPQTKEDVDAAIRELMTVSQIY